MSCQTAITIKEVLEGMQYANGSWHAIIPTAQLRWADTSRVWCDTRRACCLII